MTEEERPLGEEDSVEIVDVESGRDDASKIKRIGQVTQNTRKSDFHRPLHLNGTGATRMRLFSSKLSTPSLAAMERQINEWLDAENVEVKAVSSEIGVMQDKIKEENIILCLWY